MQANGKLARQSASMWLGGQDRDGYINTKGVVDGWIGGRQSQLKKKKKFLEK